MCTNRESRRRTPGRPFGVLRHHIVALGGVHVRQPRSVILVDGSSSAAFVTLRHHVVALGGVHVRQPRSVIHIAPT